MTNINKLQESEKTQKVANTSQENSKNVADKQLKCNQIVTEM